MKSWRMSFDEGTIILEVPRDLREEEKESMPKELVWDARIGFYRARGCDYRLVKTWIHRLGVSYEDEVAHYEQLNLVQHLRREPRDYQREAIDYWLKWGRRGIIILPTGTGKSYVAQMAMMEVQRSTLIVAPTIDLMNQWVEILTSAFQVPVGMLGGGSHEIEDLTVSTYDSAHIHAERIGHRFGFVIFDEVHHLPGRTYLQAAESFIAPFRLGLTATLERPDGRHQLLDDVIGPVVYRRSIRELAGEYLADYEVLKIVVALTPEESEEYRRNRQIYKDFVRFHNIRMSGPKGWSQFISVSSRSKEGRRAMKAYQRARRIALSAPSKLRDLEGLLRLHRKDRVIIFTNDNESVYLISRTFLIPAITHQTEAKERKELLKKFNEGLYPCLVTSRVLNEGVNIPEANVGIVLSGTASVREHVQRLGRILRKQPDKKAILYEVVTEDTVEKFVSDRRREHDAYRLK